MEEFTELQSYCGFWPVQDLLIAHLKNTSAQHHWVQCELLGAQALENLTRLDSVGPCNKDKTKKKKVCESLYSWR